MKGRFADLSDCQFVRRAGGRGEQTRDGKCDVGFSNESDHESEGGCLMDQQ
jgi:hypothetical protein